MSYSKWKKVRLGEFADVLSGYAFKSQDFSDDGIPVVKIKNIIPPIIDISDTQYVSKETYESKKKFSLSYNDILISLTGSHINQMSSAVGKIGRVKIKDKKLLLNQRVGKIYIKDKQICDQDFLYYYLIQDDIRYSLASSAGGSANQANISPSNIKDLEIVLPPLYEQKQIANTLYKLDSKIELNTEMNITLDELAQTIFQRWFIDLEFPNDDGLPYKSSGGKLVESELGFIPESWSIGRIGDFITVQNGYAFKSKQFNGEGEIGVIKIKNISDGLVDVTNTQYIDKEVAKLTNSKFLVQGSDILIAMTGSEVGKIGIVPQSEKILYLNQRVGKLVEKTAGGKEYSFYNLNRSSIQEQIKSIGMGSAQPNISSSSIENIKAVVPEKHILAKFGIVVNLIVEKYANNLYQNIVLSDIRNTILPQLMSGDIRVTEAKKEAEECLQKSN